MNVETNGTTLYAEQEGDGPPMVFVHGMCGDANVWHDQVARLRDRFQCTAYDRRGHTRSPRTDASESVGLHADDLAGLIDALGLAPAIVVGSSGGARITVDLIRRYPNLVVGAMVSEPPIGTLAPEAFATMLGEVAPQVRAAAEADGAAAAVDAFFAALCPGLWSEIGEDVKDRYRANAEMLFADLGQPPYELTAADAATINVPTLVVAGSRSHPALRTGARTLAGWLPDARLVELDSGHVTYAEQPVEFARALGAFAAETTARATGRSAATR